MTTGTTPPVYPSLYGHIATAALTQGWSVSHRDLGPERSQLTAQRGNTTLTFTFRPFVSEGPFRLAGITLAQLTPDEALYTERIQSISMIEATGVLAA